MLLNTADETMGRHSVVLRRFGADSRPGWRSIRARSIAIDSQRGACGANGSHRRTSGGSSASKSLPLSWMEDVEAKGPIVVLFPAPMGAHAK